MGDASTFDPQKAIEVCNARQATYCQRAFECLSAAALASNVAVLGSTAEECVTRLQGQFCTAAKVGCSAANTVYSPARAEACVTDIQTSTCSQFTSFAAGKPQVETVCSYVCSAPSTCFCSCVCNGGIQLVGTVSGTCSCPSACGSSGWSGQGTCS